MNQEIVTVAQAPLTNLDWSGAVSRAVEAKNARDALIAKILVEGTHYGVIPGTDKPTLYKAGAEMVSDALNLWPEFQVENRVEDWEKPLFHYEVRCTLKMRGSMETIATGLGSCNSWEDRYRYRKAERVCPECGKPAIIKGKAEYGGGWLCFKKKGGCGAKWPEKSPAILSLASERVLNDQIHTLVNTILKMAMKRAHVAAALALGFSNKFTQDMEDILGPPEEPHEPEEPQAAKPDETVASRRVAIMNGLIGKGKPFEKKIAAAKDWVKSVAKVDVNDLNSAQCALIEQKMAVGFAKDGYGERDPGAEG
jgi:hypothetical protein